MKVINRELARWTSNARLKSVRCAPVRKSYFFFCSPSSIRFPEAGVLLQLLIFRHREFRTKKEIADGVFMKDPVNQNALRTALEIYPVIVGPISVKTFSFPLDDAESLGIQAIQVVRQKLEFSKQLQLKFLWDSGHFGRADFVEDDLVHRAQFSHPFRVTQDNPSSHSLWRSRVFANKLLNLHNLLFSIRHFPRINRKLLYEDIGFFTLLVRRFSFWPVGLGKS